MWFELYGPNEDFVLSTRPGSEICWDQAIFPINLTYQSSNNYYIEVEFLVKGHVQVIQKEENFKKIPNEMINSLIPKKSIKNWYPKGKFLWRILRHFRKKSPFHTL